MTREGMNGISASAGLTRSPRRQGLDVLGADDAAAGVAERVLEEDLERDRGAPEVDPVGDRFEPIVVGEAGAERCPGAKRILD